MRKFLVAGRIDVGGLGISEERILKLQNEMGFERFFATSAREDINVQDLAAAIRSAIPWDQLPKVRSTRLFQTIRNYLYETRDTTGKVLFTVDQLYDTFVLKNQELAAETLDLRQQFFTCLGLVESQGLIKRFSFGELALLKPEMVDAYASALLTAARDESEWSGIIAEEDARNGRFSLSEDERIPDKEQEKLLLIAVIEDLIKHQIAVRNVDMDVDETRIIFLSQSSRQYPEKFPDPDATTAIWTFSGAVLNIYTTLLVRLWNTRHFTEYEFYENAAIFIAPDKVRYRLFLHSTQPGVGELHLFMDRQADSRVWSYIEEYVNTHLLRHALPRSVERSYITVCHACQTPVSNLMVKKRLALKKPWVQCPVCETRISLVRTDTFKSQQSLLRQRMVNQFDLQIEAEQKRQIIATSLEGRRALDDFDVFICHNHQDRTAIIDIAKKLKEQGVLPWLDIWEMQTGDEWEPAVTHQIRKVPAVVVFIGANGIGDVQRRELNFAIHMEAHIIPVLLPDAPRRPDIPLQLAGQSWVDFRDKTLDPIDHLIRAILGDENETSDKSD